ncbi:MAG: hypothetical protein JNK65_02880, partial [Deltaproteobacteria bacterium]|nr:hypothetical protein [Deltaproteobacteria bacterium]
NLQLGLAIGLAHHLMGNRLISIEKGLELSQESHKPPPSSSNRHPFLKPAFLGWETEGSSLHDLGRSDSRDTKEIKVQKYFSTGTPRESLVDLFSLFKNIQLDDPSLEGILKKLSSKQRLAAIIHLYTVGKLSSERAQSLF